MSYDPIEQKRTARYTRQELKDFWQGPGHVVQRLRKENPAKYLELHTAGEQEGILGPSLIKPPAPNTPYRPPTKSYSAEELKLRGEFTEDYCRQLFASGDSKAAKELFEANPERYQDAKDASISFGILPARLTPRVKSVPVIEKEWTMVISDALADESNVPRGTEITYPQLEQLCKQKVDRIRLAQEAERAKNDAARQAELGKLTATQQLEQAARDRHQADLDRLVELTTPKPAGTPEAYDVAVGRMVAKEKQNLPL